MNFMLLSATLLAIGIYGLLSKRHLVKILISIELIAMGASMNFILLASSSNIALGEAFLALAFSTDTCLTAIILALLIIAAKKYGTCDVRKLAEIAESEQGKNENGGDE